MPLERIAEFNDLKRGLLYAHDDCAPPGNRKIWGEGKPLEPESSNLMKKYTPDRTIIN
ncbi:MAG: hypothetical protein KGJ89_01470 [Patescibacteria group bacterium]|nr:hypothetical protein [Patescibacteria group bacterium]MDE2226610.1 hypothetical protein [Patescibacteria group bacterium]